MHYVKLFVTHLTVSAIFLHPVIIAVIRREFQSGNKSIIMNIPFDCATLRGASEPFSPYL